MVKEQVIQITTEEDLHSFSQLVVSKLRSERLFKNGLDQGLEAFLDPIYLRPYVSTIGFIGRKESHASKILDVYLLASSPIDLSRDSEGLRAITYLHAASLERINRSFNSFLHIYDPRKYSTAEVFRKHLIKEAHSYSSANLLACAQFKR